MIKLLLITFQKMPKKEKQLPTNIVHKYEFLRPLLQNTYKVTSNLGILKFNYNDIIRSYIAKCEGDKKSYDRSSKTQRFIGDLLSDFTFYSNDENESHSQKLKIASIILNRANNVNNFDKCEALSFLLTHDNKEKFYPMYCQQILDLHFVEHIDHVDSLLNSNFNKYIQENSQLEEVRKVQDFYYNYISTQIDYIYNNFCNSQIKSSFGTKFMKDVYKDEKYYVMAISIYCDKLITYYPFISQDAKNKLMHKCLDKMNSNLNIALTSKYIANYIILNNCDEYEIVKKNKEHDSDKEDSQDKGKENNNSYSFKYCQTVLDKCKRILWPKDIQQNNDNLKIKYNSICKTINCLQQELPSCKQQQHEIEIQY